MGGMRKIKQKREITGNIEALTQQVLETANQVESGIKSTNDKAIETLNNALKCGKLLLQLKKLLTHGAWGEWQVKHCAVLSARTIQRYMKLAKELPKAPHVADCVSLRQAYLLSGAITAPKPKMENIGKTQAPPVPPVPPAEETDVIGELSLADLIQAVIERLDSDLHSALVDGESGDYVIMEAKPLAEWFILHHEKNDEMRRNKLAAIQVDLVNAPLPLAA